ncbi:MAG: SDR family oxidoreductase [Bacillota bacterium]|nr:SDR family oxidoreductase [Bacillota bacterium]
MKDYLRVCGKTAIITGSAQGIGRGMAIELATYGIKIAVLDIDDKLGTEVRDIIRKAGGTAEYIHCDIFSVEDIKKAVKKTAEAFGGIDILVNNVGGGEPSCGFETITDERWDKYIRFNLYGAFYMTREVFPYMKARKKGKIVNISSGYAIGGGDFCAHYATAKAGLIGFTTSVAKEAAPYNINVNVIPVPTTDTPAMRLTDTPEMIEAEIRDTPLGRIAVPEDIANTVLFLVSEAADYVTGQIVAPNGGKRMLV